MFLEILSLVIEQPVVDGQLPVDSPTGLNALDDYRLEQARQAFINNPDYLNESELVNLIVSLQDQYPSVRIILEQPANPGLGQPTSGTEITCIPERQCEENETRIQILPSTQCACAPVRQ